MGESTKARALAIEAPPAFIEAVRALSVEGLAVSEPSLAGSSADILDSPAGGDRIRPIREVVTILARTGKAVAELGHKVGQLLPTLSGQVVVVTDPVTGRRLGVLSAGSTEEDIRKLFWP